MIRSLIAACDENYLIGADGKMPWNLPGDMKLFRRLTMGKPIIMGRLTYESLGRPLPGRTNIVLSRREGLVIPGCLVASNLQHAFELAEETGATEGMVIGGGKVYEIAIEFADRLYLSVIHHRFRPRLAREKVYFPQGTWHERRGAKKVEEEFHPASREDRYAWTALTINFDSYAGRFAERRSSHPPARLSRPTSQSITVPTV